MVGRDTAALFTPEDRAVNRPRVELELTTDTGFADDERWHVRKDGSRFFASGSMEGLRDESGRLRGYVKVVRDISERKRAEEELRASEQRRRLALDSAELGAWNIDLASGTVTADDRFRAIFGAASNRLTLEEGFAIIHAEDRDRCRAEVATATARPDHAACYSSEYRVVHADGSVHWVSARGRATSARTRGGDRL